jgi:DNA mismatch repair protein MutL
LVQVIDNGLGMSVTDARMCFERHATSKIRLAEDLFSLHTKGFRGEALASIAAIAHVELKTRRDQEELGTHIVIEGSKFMSQEAAVLPKGTSFLVKNLFFNIPARRNFLKSDTVEYRHIVDEFQRVVMAHPNIHFTFYHNGSEMFNLPKSNFRQRIVNIFAGKTNEKLVPIQEETEILNIQGFVCKSEYAKKSRGEQFFFVNDRYIKSGYLHHAVMAAYEGLLAMGNQPSYFIYLQVPPNTIDINIHPTKTEIKFDDESALYAILRSSIKHSLGQFNVSPILDFERDFNLDTPYDYKNQEAQVPLIEIDRSFNPFESDVPNKSFPTFRKPESTANWESLYVGNDNFKSSLTDFQFEGTAINSSIFDDHQVEQYRQKSYQLQKKYIVLPLQTSLVIIDQNKAHQRILYEELLGCMTIKNASSQQLLFPIVLFFAKNEIQIIAELQESLQATGFVFGINQIDTIEILGTPINITETEVKSVLEDLISDLQDGIPETSFSQNDRIAKSLSKSMSIKTGAYMTDSAQENLVNSLFACKEPNVSPFNKPTFITLRVEDLDKKFAI